MDPILTQPTAINPIINFATRQPMETQPKPKRGGKREPLPRLTITIPNFTKYQTTTKGRREWVRIQADICRNRQIIRACKQVRNGNPLAIFLGLVCMADASGVVSDVTAAELGRDLMELEYRSVQSALVALVENGLITLRASDEQVTSKGQASGEQETDKCSSLEQSSNDAGLTPTTRQDNNKTEQENAPLIPQPRKRVTGSPEFEAFWRDYPNKGPKPEALAQWQSLDPNAETVAAIMDGLAKAKASQRWADGFVVQACRFLRDERWLDSWPPRRQLPTDKPETHIDANGVERYPSGIQKYDLSLYTAGW